MLDPKIGAEELTNISGYQMLSADKYLKSYLPPTKLIKSWRIHVPIPTILLIPLQMTCCDPDAAFIAYHNNHHLKEEEDERRSTATSRDD